MVVIIAVMEASEQPTDLLAFLRPPGVATAVVIVRIRANDGGAGTEQKDECKRHRSETKYRHRFVSCKRW